MAKSRTTQQKDLRFWLYEGRRCSDIVMQRARDITANTSWRRSEDETHLKLYSVQEWRGVYGLDRRRSAMRGTMGRNGNRRLSLNVVRNVVNAATSTIVRSRPYVSFLTDGADYRTMVLSRKRERFCQAHFIREKIHQLSQRRVKNGNVFGTGGTKVIRNGKRITCEHILPGEILVDEQESIGGEPPCIYQAKLVDKSKLMAMLPKKFHGDIEKASSVGNYWQSSNSSQALVVFAWHFPCEDDKSDGWEVMCIDGVTLYKRPYRWSTFPGTFFRWEEEPFGFYGAGLPAELLGIQYEINTLLRMIQENAYKGGNLKCFVEKGSKVQLGHISNSLGIPIIEYSGTQPMIHANDVASVQIFNHLSWLDQKAYNITGVSQLDAQSQTPFATMSGKARLVHQNSESLRFKHTVERYENGYVELAERILEAATDLADGYGGAEKEADETVIFRGRNHLEQISYADVALREGETQLDIERWSSSQLAHTPGARMEQVDFLVANNYITRERGLCLMDLGSDTRSETDVATAPFDIVDEMIERIILDGEMQTPRPYTNLQYALERSQLEIQRCELRDGVPPDRLDMLREFREQVIDLQLTATKPAANTNAGAVTAPVPDGMPVPPDTGIPPEAATPQLPPVMAAGVQ